MRLCPGKSNEGARQGRVNYLCLAHRGNTAGKSQDRRKGLDNSGYCQSQIGPDTLPWVYSVLPRHSDKRDLRGYGDGGEDGEDGDGTRMACAQCRDGFAGRGCREQGRASQSTGVPSVELDVMGGGNDGGGSV